MRVICLGAGAIGGFFGGQLVAGGQPVEFLVREGRKTQLERDGLVIKSRYGDIATAVTATTAAEIQGHADVILLTCKAYDLPAAIDTIRPLVGPNTAVLPLLNGIAHIETLNAAFGANRVIGGLAKIAATLNAEGEIIHLNDWRYITFGEQDGSVSDRVTALKEAFDKTPVIATLTTEILQEMWNKVVHLSTVAGMTTLMRASIGEIARTPDGAALSLSLLESNAEIARREGFAPTEAFLAEYRALFADQTSAYTASMLRDIERRGPVEADHVIGFMLKKAQQHQMDDRFYQIILTHLKSYEQRRAAQRW